MRLFFSDGAEVEVGTSDSIVSELKKSGLMFPHSCEVGRCESCKVQVLRGETEAFRAELSLSEPERECGFVLACCRKVRSDLELNITLPRQLVFRPRTTPCKLSNLDVLCERLYRVELQLPKTPEFKFAAGQHVDFIYPDGSARKYSIASIDRVSNRLTFLVRAHHGGRFEQFICDASMGALFKLRGPLGTFCLDSTKLTSDLVFVATGTGISVFHAMLEEMMARNLDTSAFNVTLFWGVSDEREFDMVDLSFYDGNLALEKIASKPTKGWSGKVGRVTDVLAQSNLSITSQVFLCGNPSMITDVTSLLLSRGFDRHAIKSDLFVSTNF